MRIYLFFLLFFMQIFTCHAMPNNGLEKQKEILTFWFGELTSAEKWNKDKAKRWFQKNEEFDQFIQKTFEEDVLRAASGEYSHWKNTPRGYLALIVLLDQFPRNIFRNTSKAYAYDAIALDLAIEGMQKGMDKELFCVERQFFYLPLQHSENKEMQNLSIKLYEDLLSDAPDSMKDYFNSVQYYANKHLQIVEKFGRFPHRNNILERESTEREIEFLKQQGSSF